jgi:tripartite ATP-independent transporter DctP family solute receptor
MKDRTSMLRWSASVALGAILIAVAPVRAAEYKLTHSADVQHPNHLAAEDMAKRIDERTKGDVKIKLFPNNALGSPPETTEQARLGVIEFAILSPSQLDKYNRAFGVVFIPYQFDDFAHAHRTLDETASAWLQEQHKKIGFVHIANFEWGFRSITNSRRAIGSPEDVKGLKLRVPPEIQIKAAMEALGAVTATIAFSEVYLALANSTVDGQDNPVPTNYSQKFFEVNKHLALTKHVYTPMMLVANARAWERISPANRAIVEEEGRRAGQKAREEVQAKENFYIAEMEKSGVQTTRPDVAKFRERMDPAYKAIKDWIGDETAWQTWAKFVTAARRG